MHIDYADITGRIDEEPRWWLDGVPRYCAFAPDQAGIYAREVALVRIEGQGGSGDPYFEIAVQSPSDLFPYGIRAALAAIGMLYVGDPPNHEDRVSPHMSGCAIEILQYWSRDGLEWQRESRFEGPLEDENGAQLRPVCQLLVYDRAGDRWPDLIARRDAAAIRDLLAEVGCDDPERAAIHIINSALAEERQREFRRVWEKYPDFA